MGETRETMWCNRCQRNTGHLTQAPNHVLHFLIAFFTCGFWLFIWIALMIASRSNPSHCTVCGAEYTTPRVKATG